MIIARLNIGADIRGACISANAIARDKFNGDSNRRSSGSLRRSGVYNAGEERCCRTRNRETFSESYTEEAFRVSTLFPNSRPPRTAPQPQSGLWRPSSLKSRFKRLAAIRACSPILLCGRETQSSCDWSTRNRISATKKERGKTVERDGRLRRSFINRANFAPASFCWLILLYNRRMRGVRPRAIPAFVFPG